MFGSIRFLCVKGFCTYCKTCCPICFSAAGTLSEIFIYVMQRVKPCCLVVSEHCRHSPWQATVSVFKASASQQSHLFYLFWPANVDFTLYFLLSIVVVRPALFPTLTPSFLFFVKKTAWISVLLKSLYSEWRIHIFESSRFSFPLNPTNEQNQVSASPNRLRFSGLLWGCFLQWSLQNSYSNVYLVDCTFCRVLPLQQHFQDSDWNLSDQIRRRWKSVKTKQFVSKMFSHEQRSERSAQEETFFFKRQFVLFKNYPMFILEAAAFYFYALSCL